VGLQSDIAQAGDSFTAINSRQDAAFRRVEAAIIGPLDPLTLYWDRVMSSNSKSTTAVAVNSGAGPPTKGACVHQDAWHNPQCGWCTTTIGHNQLRVMVERQGWVSHRCPADSADLPASDAEGSGVEGLAAEGGSGTGLECHRRCTHHVSERSRHCGTVRYHSSRRCMNW
jgi:hypothetical protein